VQGWKRFHPIASDTASPFVPRRRPTLSAPAALSAFNASAALMLAAGEPAGAAGAANPDAPTQRATATKPINEYANVFVPTLRANFVI
jgi:hypothetical protein